MWAMKVLQYASHQQIGDSSLGLGFVLLSYYLLHRCLCERDSKLLGQ